jgi:hypothetical protein
MAANELIFVSFALFAVVSVSKSEDSAAGTDYHDYREPL